MTARGALLGVVLAVSVASPVRAEDIAVIVHPERRVELGVDDLARIFLKQRRFWGTGERILPVNRESGSAAREAFVHFVFGSDAPRFVVYWNRQYFRGVVPPATLASDEAVRRFVSGERRAIGYVHPSVVDDSVRVVLELKDPAGGGGFTPRGGLRWQLARLFPALCRSSGDPC